MVVVAVDQHDQGPLIGDEPAGRFLPVGAGAVVALARWDPVRCLLFSLTEKRIPVLWAEILCRKRYIDDRTLDAVQVGLGGVVILGSGMDTRPYRLPGLAQVPVYEVDLPTNINRERDRVCRLYGAVPGNVALVPVGFETVSAEKT
jgi:methyltransferase (TIGR00027 family)